MAGLLRDEGRRIPSLRVLQAFTETLTPEAQTRIEAGFGVPVKNLYSCTEAGYLASVCPDGHGLPVHAENVLLEVLDENDRPCRPGETGRVMLTTLHNHATPLVRYDILDTATVGAASCPCGRGLPLLTRVDGKAHPVLRLTGERVASSRALVIALENLGLSRQHQVVQTALDHFTIRIVPNRNWQDDSPSKVVQAAHSVLPSDVQIEVVPVDRLELTAGGKLRDVVVAVSEPEA
ncbi:MAG: phenylacetate--CoA ligase family protein [Planctomycetes bacterium]|nr:phenylacetate--CoA ligase family protein [Planctomycetota bacterium]